MKLGREQELDHMDFINQVEFGSHTEGFDTIQDGQLNI